MKVYSEAGATPRTGPLPISKGLIYIAPFPGGGTYIYSSQSMHKLLISKILDRSQKN